MHRKPSRWSLAIVGALLGGMAQVGAARPAAAAELPAPQIQGPPSGTTTRAPLFTWQRVAGAAKYRLQVSANGFVSIAYTVDTHNTNVAPPVELPAAESPLDWRVAAVDPAGVVGEWALSSFTYRWDDQPDVTPPPGALHEFAYPSAPPLFSWTPLDGARRYRVQIDDEPSFVAATSVVTKATTYIPTTRLAPDKTWYFHVQGVSDNGSLNSRFSEPLAFRLKWSDAASRPNLTSPVIDPEEPRDIALRWTPVLGAAQYRVQVNPAADFPLSGMAVNRLVFGTAYSPPVTLDNDDYYWRVQALDSDGVMIGAWSTAGQFTVAFDEAPLPLGPANGSTALTEPRLSWTPVRTASEYEIWIGRDSNFSPDTYSVCRTDNTTFTPFWKVSNGTRSTHICKNAALGAIVNPGTTHYWKVRGVDAPYSVNNVAGVVGQWSSVWSFVVRTGPVTPLSPANGATVAVPTLTWQPLDDVTKYEVNILNSSGVQVHKATTYASSYTPNVLLDPAVGPFKWYVVPIDAADRLGLTPNPATWTSFSLGALPSGVSGAIQVTAPAGTTELPGSPAEPSGHTVRMPAMTWQAYAGADHYRIYYGVSGSGSYTELAIGKKLHYPAYTFTGQLPSSPTAYFFAVRAYNAGGGVIASAESAGRRFFIDAPRMTAGRYVGPADCDATCDASHNHTPELRWSPVPGADYYRIYLSPDGGFSNATTRVVDTHHNSWTSDVAIKDSTTGTPWHWHVRPCFDAYCAPFEPPYEPLRRFKKRSPLAVLDGPGVLGTSDLPVVANQVTLNWKDYLLRAKDTDPQRKQEAESYLVEVSTTPDFTDVIDSRLVDQSTYTPFERTYPEGQLYWRVQAKDGAGNLLPVTAGLGLEKKSPAIVPTSPTAGGSVDRTPRFEWPAQAFAASYQVEVYKNQDLLWSTANRLTGTPATTPYTAWSPSSALATGTYAWRVRRIDIDGKPGPWSAGRLFTITQAAPDLTAPVNGTLVPFDNFVLDWDAVPGASAYKLEVSGSSTFTTLVENQKTLATEWAPVRKYSDGLYHWRVRVLNGDGAAVAVSGSRSFRIDSSRPTVTATSHTATTRGAVTAPWTVTFSEPVVGVSTGSFRLVVAGTTNVVAGTVSPGATTGTSTATFKPTKPLVPGLSYTASVGPNIRDLAGNAVVAKSWTSRVSGTVENDSPVLIHTWDRQPSSSSYGSAFARSKSVGASMSFTFTGTSASVVGVRSSAGGYADVYLDGVKKATVNFYSASVRYKSLMWSATGLSNARHTVKVVAKGTRQAGSADSWVNIDAFGVGTALHQENSAAVTSRFRSVSSASAYGGTYAVENGVDTTTAPTYSLKFYGTEVTWYSTRSVYGGKAAVYVDGKLLKTVDLYSGVTGYKYMAFRSPLLTPGLHEVRIVALSTANASSKGRQVAVDRLSVR